MNIDVGSECLDQKIVRNYNDGTIKLSIFKEYNIDNLDELSIEKRNKIIKDVYNKKCASIRQLSRILEIGKAIIERILKQDS